MLTVRRQGYRRGIIIPQASAVAEFQCIWRQEALFDYMRYVIVLRVMKVIINVKPNGNKWGRGPHWLCISTESIFHVYGNHSRRAGRSSSNSLTGPQNPIRLPIHFNRVSLLAPMLKKSDILNLLLHYAAHWAFLVVSLRFPSCLCNFHDASERIIQSEWDTAWQAFRIFFRQILIY